jgi:hypothetical protein
MRTYLENLAERLEDLPQQDFDAFGRELRKLIEEQRARTDGRVSKVHMARYALFLKVKLRRQLRRHEEISAKLASTLTGAVSEAARQYPKKRAERLFQERQERAIGIDPSSVIDVADPGETS